MAGAGLQPVSHKLQFSPNPKNKKPTNQLKATQNVPQQSYYKTRQQHNSVK